MSKEETFDTEIEKLEEEIVDFLLNKSYFFAGQKTPFAIIKVYFLTRRDLTQEMIKKLTGLSRGTISQELKKLIDAKVIRKNKVSSTGEITYTLDSVEFAFIHAFYNAQKDLVDFDKELAELKADIEKNLNDINDLNGFDEINQIVNLFSLSMPFTLGLYKMLEEELRELKNKRS